MSAELKKVRNPKSIGVRGNLPPLSWQENFPLTDKNKDGIYEGYITVDPPHIELEYKYFYDTSMWENNANRKLNITREQIFVKDKWNDGPTAVDQRLADSVAKQQLYQKIASLDSMLSDGYNRHDVDAVMKLFSPDLEFYHDKGGLTNFSQNREAFKSSFAKNNGLRRELLKNTLEVFPIKDYGAIEIGSHRFCHEENGKPDCGVFRFTMVWKNTNGDWKLTRVVSYDH
jgi:ketosteroid isomerase-like protein